MEVSEKTLIKNLITTHPEVVEILMAYGLQCVNCHFSDIDTLGDGARMHGLSDEDVAFIIKDVSKIVK